MATARAFTAYASSALGGPEWLRRRREEAFSRWEAAGLPSQSEEVWRYSRIDELDLDAYSPVPPGTAAMDPDTLPYGDAFPGSAALVWSHDAQVTHVELGDELASKGVVVGTVLAAPPGGNAAAAGEIAEEHYGTAAPPRDGLGNLAGAFVDDVVVVSIPDGVVIDSPIVVVHWGSASQEPSLGSNAIFPRTLIVAGTNSKATVVEISTSAPWGAVGTRLLVVPVTEVVVAANAHLDYVSLQDLGPHDWQIAHQASTVGRDARFTSFTTALGADYARVRTDSKAVAPGAETRLFAAYFGTGTQMHDFRTLQDHAAPHTKSDLYFKGAVADEARSVYSGLIRICKGAVRSVAFQENRNLVLSEGAHADSVPNLDIQENDVRCSHASAVGPVDPDQRYYLESRGVPPEEAEQLVVEGFFDDIVARAPGVPAVRAMIHQKVTAKLKEKF